MFTYETRLRIHAPIERVYAFLEDPRRWPAYSEKVQRIQVIGRSPERVRVTGHLGFQTYTADLGLTRFSQGGFAFEQLRGDTPFLRGYLLLSLEDGFTMLEHREEWQFEHRWAERLWAPRLRAMGEREADRIKQHVEWALVHDLLHARPEEPVVTISRLTAPDMVLMGMNDD